VSSISAAYDPQAITPHFYLPEGTVLCDAIKLIRKVEENEP
jgi:hypothetical protein